MGREPRVIYRGIPVENLRLLRQLLSPMAIAPVYTLGLIDSWERHELEQAGFVIPARTDR